MVVRYAEERRWGTPMLIMVDRPSSIVHRPSSTPARGASLSRLIGLE